MKQFPSAGCKKCGASGISTRYSSGNPTINGKPTIKTECLVKTCGRCGFQWTTPCQDVVDSLSQFITNKD